MLTYLTKRDATYYFRRVIPEELRPAFNGKRELTHSLRTKDHHEAAERCRLEAVKSDNLFEQARLATRTTASTLTSTQSGIRPVREGEVLSHAAIVLEAYRRKRDRCGDEGRLTEFNAEVRETLRDQESYITHGPLPTEGETMADALRRAEAMKMGLTALLTGEGAALLSERFIAERQARAVPKSNALMLLDLVVKWAAEKQPTAKSVDMWRRTCRLFSLVNGEKPVSAITKADVLAFKDHLISKGRAPATVDSRLNHLRSLFRFAVENDIIPTDPAANVKAPPAKRAKEARLPYDAGALKSVFESAIYIKGERPNRGAGEAAYWLPLLALYTGARLGELGQLRPKDVAQEVYQDAEGAQCKAWVIRIVEDEADGLTLKNVGSNRRVPLHQVLIDLGFLRFVDDARANGQARIFPALKPDRYGSVTGNWTKWFGYHLRQVCGVLDKRITFHSFRHTFKHHARACGMEKAVNDALTGHESGDAADQYGGLEYPLLPLIRGMASYRVADFALPPPSVRAE